MAVSLNRLCDQSCLGSPAMRQPYGRLTPAAVGDLAFAALANALPWRPYRRRVTAQALLDLIPLTAALGSSLWAVVRRRAFGFSHETARQALDANLPDPETSYRQLNQGKALTTTADPRRPLLSLRAALLLRQAWGWWQRALAGRRTNGAGWRAPVTAPPGGAVGWQGRAAERYATAPP